MMMRAGVVRRATLAPPSAAACRPAAAPLPPPAPRTCTDSGSGLMLTNMSVLPLPPRHGCSRCVSLELRYGMCGVLAASACAVVASVGRGALAWSLGCLKLAIESATA